MQLGVGINWMMKGAKGKVILEVLQREEKETLTKELERSMGSEYKIYEPKKRLPKIKVVGIEENIDRRRIEEEELVEKISRKNRLDIAKEGFKIKIVKKIQINATQKTLILETDPDTQKELLDVGRMNIGFQRYKIYNYVSILRCYKCCGYNHMAKDCENEVSYRKCGGAHNGKDCQSEKVKCINCTRMNKKYNVIKTETDHVATHYDCPVYK